MFGPACGAAKYPRQPATDRAAANCHSVHHATTLCIDGHAVIRASPGPYASYTHCNSSRQHEWQSDTALLLMADMCMTPAQSHTTLQQLLCGYNERTTSQDLTGKSTSSCCSCCCLSSSSNQPHQRKHWIPLLKSSQQPIAQPHL